MPELQTPETVEFLFMEVMEFKIAPEVHFSFFSVSFFVTLQLSEGENYILLNFHKI